MSDDIPAAYEGIECAKCGDSVRPGEWCGNDSCPLGSDPEPEREEIPPKQEPDWMDPDMEDDS